MKPVSWTQVATATGYKINNRIYPYAQDAGNNLYHQVSVRSTTHYT